MEKFVIEGGAPLSGEVTVAGNKNAALPILAACLLTEEEVLLHRVPRIRDTEAQIALLEQPRRRRSSGSATTASSSAPPGVSAPVVDEELSSQIRASFLLAGPLLARFGAAKMPPPGGDFIGRRRLDAHLDAFKDLGARVDGSRWIELSAPTGLCACEIFMDEPSVMGTENALMAAALTPGQTTISNAASEPHVQDLAAPADRDGGRGRRRRLQRDDRQRPDDARRRRVHDLPRPHRSRQLHGARRGDRGRAADPRRRPEGPAQRAPPVPPPRAATPRSRGRT